MADTTTRLMLEILGKDVGASRAFERVADAMDHAGREAKDLDGQITHTRTSITNIAKDIDRTGDLRLFKNLSREQSQLRKLLKVKDLLPNEKDGEESGRRVSRGLFGSLSASAGAFGVRLSASIANNIPGALGGALSALGPVVQTAIVGGIVGAIIAGSSFIAAAFSGALVAGLGAGTIAAGIVVALRDQRIKTAAAGLGQTVLSGLEEAASVFVGPLLESIGILKRGFASVLPGIKQAFASVAPLTTTLTKGLVGFVQNLLPGLNKLLSKSGPLVETLARGFQQAGIAVGRFFTELSQNAAGAKEGLGDLFLLANATIVEVGKTLSVLSKAYFGLKFIGKVLSGDVTGAVGMVSEANAEAEESAANAGKSFSFFGLQTAGAGAAAQAATPAVTSWGAALKEAGVQSGFLADALRRLNGDFLSVEEAQSNVEAAIDNATDAFKENGKTLDLNTPKGRANAEALRAIADAGVQSAEDVYKAKVATGDLNGAQQSAIAILQQAKDAYIKNRTAITGNKTEAKKLADQIFGTPKQWKTTFTAATEAASLKITGLQKQVRNLRGKTITITTRFVTSGSSQGEHISGGIGSGTQRSGAAAGGLVEGAGTSTSDSNPFMLSKGEYVVRAAAVRALGLGFLNQINRAGPGDADKVYRKPAFRRPVSSAAAAPAPAAVNLHISGSGAWGSMFLAAVRRGDINLTAGGARVTVA